MKKILAITLSMFTIFACSMGKRSVPNLEVFKGLYFIGDNTGEVYQKKCPKRARDGKCKKKLVKKVKNFCDPETFKKFQQERYILVKESDFY